MVKILYIANIRLPTEKAHGIQIMKMCEALAKAGASVELVIPTRKNAIQDDPFSYYAVPATFRIVRLPIINLLAWGPLGYLVSLAWFLQSARRHAERYPGACVYTREPLAALFIPDTTIEVHVRSSSRIARYAIRKARNIVTITEGLKQALVDDGVPEGKITVLADAVDIGLFDTSLTKAEARHQTRLPAEGKIALYAGSFSLYSWKGLDTFIAAARQHPEILFVCVGGTAEEAARVGGRLSSNVRCIGKVSYAEVPRYLRAADVLVLPNKPGDTVSERYTSPLKLFEYLASGTPMVASDLPSIREIVSEKEATLFIPGDSQALAQAIISVFADRESAAVRASAGKEKMEKYTWDVRAARVLALLKN